SGPRESGQIYVLKSDLLKEQRQIFVSLPVGYDTMSAQLPVIYVLDAEYRFDVAQSIFTYFSISTKIPKAILIGVANPTREARQRDYLPENRGGKAQYFSKFLASELIPFVEKNFKASQKRYIVGHSHGGVFVIYTLLNNPMLFNGYISIDPGLKEIYGKNDTLLTRDLSNKRLYLASSDVAYGYLEDVAADMQADFAIFKNYLYQTHQTNNLVFRTDHINDDHGNAYIGGFSRGMRWMFDWRFE
ncbi:MAG TPA: alpha/beta hydrolase-fold protein, partial [Cyclobacteriaceae bacterium]|nr:alpha/beta hydrolase-fold protein [Cyclobacteriaceae bacterium]